MMLNILISELNFAKTPSQFKIRQRVKLNR